jgi:hypothetical protein
MSLDNAAAVDAIGVEKNSDTAILTIIDSWAWEHEEFHLEALQEKLNAYFQFIESGQIYESYPDANGKAIRIDIVARFPIPVRALAFLEQASRVASQLGIAITHRLHGASGPGT